jgi:hypothetical protein
MRKITLLTLFLICRPISSQSSSTPSLPAQSKTQVVLLGTGTPNADPDRSGPALAVVVNDTPYVVDSGPGVVRRAAAAERRGVRGTDDLLCVAGLGFLEPGAQSLSHRRDGRQQDDEKQRGFAGWRICGVLNAALS